MCPIRSCSTNLILWTNRIYLLNVNKGYTGYMYRMKEAGYLLQLTASEILAKILWNHEGSSDVSQGLPHPTAVRYK